MIEIDFDADELEAASRWHDGMNSMLYAISSTGSLRRGTIRPRGDDGQPLSDQEWLRYLAEELETEAEWAAREAAKQARTANRRERADLRHERQMLLSIAEKARDAAQQLNGLGCVCGPGWRPY